MKTVSVVMCTYNGARYIREQLDSILRQTYPASEVIVQDDGSTDGTTDIVREYAGKHPVVRLFENEHNLGFNPNFKSAVMKATGDYVAISDQDDVWFPEKIAKQVEAIGDCDMCASPCLKGHELETATLYKYKFSFEQQLFASIYGHTMLCRRDFIQDERHWTDSLWYDWSLTLYAYIEGGVAIVDEPLNWHRHHDQEVTINTTAVSSALAPYVKGYQRYRQLQQTDNWKKVYTLVYEHTGQQQALVHRLSQLLLDRSPWALLQLCWLCMKHRELIYPSRNTHGVMGRVRSFCFPIIHAYYTDMYRDLSI